MIDAALHDLEQAVIGAVIARPDNLALLPSLEATHFAAPWSRAAWSAIRNCEAGNTPIDVTTLADEMARIRDRGIDAERPIDRERAETGILVYLGECCLRCPTIDNAIEYARRVKDHALLRMLTESFAELIDECRGGEYTGAEILSRALGAMSVLDVEQPEGVAAIGEIVQRRLAQLDEIRKERELGQRAITGFPTGIARLDEKLGGWQPGIVSIVAARPGHGKSSLGLATADACSEAGVGCHVFSLEDTGETYADRTLSRASGIAATDLKTCNVDKYGHEILKRVIPSVVQRKHWLFDERSGISAAEIVRSVRRHRRDNNTRVVIVDYVQLVSKPNPRQNQHEALSEIMTTLATAAKQDRIAYVVMSQLNRENEKRPDRRPMLSDLRESGSLEERAKCVVGVYRGAAHGKEPKAGIDYPKNVPAPTPDEFERLAQLLVLKNSSGPLGLVRVTWTGPTMRFD